MKNTEQEFHNKDETDPDIQENVQKSEIIV